MAAKKGYTPYTKGAWATTDCAWERFVDAAETKLAASERRNAARCDLSVMRHLHVYVRPADYWQQECKDWCEPWKGEPLPAVSVFTSRIAEDCGITPRRASTSLARLRDFGLIIELSPQIRLGFEQGTKPATYTFALFAQDSDKSDSAEYGSFSNEKGSLINPDGPLPLITTNGQSLNDTSLTELLGYG